MTRKLAKKLAKEIHDEIATLVLKRLSEYDEDDQMEVIDRLQISIMDDGIV